MFRLTLDIFQTKWIKIDYLFVAFVGLILLLTSAQMSYQGVRSSDEVVYAVVARNLIEQGNLNTNLYRTDSIIKRGYPSRDVHTPGYMILLAVSFVLFGINDFAAALPSQLSYILTGLVFYKIGKSLFGSTVAIWGTLIYYLYPFNFFYANRVMADTPFAMLSVIYIALWLKIGRDKIPKILDVSILAILLILGLLVRQTFALFLPPTLFILIKAGLSHRKYWPLIVFVLLSFILFLDLFVPLAQNRAYYPNTFERVVEAGDWATGLEIIKTSVLNNIAQTLSPEPIQIYIFLVNLILAVVSVAGLWFGNDSIRRLAILYFYSLWLMVLMSSVFYGAVVMLATARNLNTVFLPGLLLLVAGLFKIKPWFVRYFGIGFFLIFVSVSTLRFIQPEWWGVQAVLTEVVAKPPSSEIITKYLGPYSPHVIMVRNGFRYAWDGYPTVVIWDFPMNYGEMQVLEERLPIDAIVVNTEQERDVIIDAMANQVLKQQYTLLFPDKVEKYYFFINERLRLGIKN